MKSGLNSNHSDEKRDDEYEDTTWPQKFTQTLLRLGVETHGITPVPPEQRNDRRLYQMFFVWFSANMNILTFSSGTIGPVFFNMGLRQTLVILLIVDLLCSAIPAYFAVFGPKLGTRAMVQARFSWGYYGAVIPSVLNVFSMQGFLILNTIIGGQTLASVSEHLSPAVGIVIVAIISLVVSFCGYRVVHWFESIAWAPNVVAFITMLAIGAKNFTNYTPAVPATPASILSLTSTIVSSILSWCPMTPDYGVYHDCGAPSAKIFLYTYLGFFSATLTGNMLGAAFAAAAFSEPAWKAGLGDGNNVGGLISAILAPSGGFGKFLTVMIALSIPSACAPTIYSFGTSFMAVSRIFSRIPRYIYAIVSTAILIPVAIVGETRFYTTFVNILSLIGYWSTAFAAIILVEHFVFRNGDFWRYNVDAWDKPRQLAPGLAAILAFFGAFGIIIPSMSQVWYTGPIAKAGTGDIGVFTGFATAILLYIPLRLIERRVWPDHNA